jgi:hypothetical protein
MAAGKISLSDLNKRVWAVLKVSESSLPLDDC